MNQHVPPSLGAALSAALVVACGSDRPYAGDDQYAHLLTFDSARVRLATARDTTTVVAELAKSPEQHTMAHAMWPRARNGLRIGDRVLLQDTLTQPGATRPPNPHTR